MVVIVASLSWVGGGSVTDRAPGAGSYSGPAGGVRWQSAGDRETAVGSAWPAATVTQTRREVKAPQPEPPP